MQRAGECTIVRQGYLIAVAGDGSPVAQAIIKFIKDKKGCTVASSEMHSKLKVVAQLGVDVDRDKT